MDQTNVVEKEVMTCLSSLLPSMLLENYRNGTNSEYHATACTNVSVCVCFQTALAHVYIRNLWVGE